MPTPLKPEERKLAELRFAREEQQRARHEGFLRKVLAVGLVNAVIAAALMQFRDLALIGVAPAAVWFVSLFLYADIFKPLRFPPDDLGFDHGRDWRELFQRFYSRDRLGSGLLLLASFPLCRQLFRLLAYLVTPR